MTGSGQRSFHPVTSFNLGRSATSGVVAHGPRASRRSRPRVSCAAMLQLTALLLVAQIQLPAPRGYVNDFAGVLDSASVAHMEAVITEVRAKTRGEIAVVTLSDIADRPAADVALEIGRRWGVGAKGEAGDPAKNLGVVVLLVPLKNHRPGTGQVFIATGRGAEGFLTDARVGRIRDAMTPYLAREEYGAGLAHGVELIAQAFAQEFGVTLEAAPPPPRPVAPEVWLPTGATLFWVIVAFVLIVSILQRRRGRRGLPWWWVGGGWSRSGWGGGWGGGGGGGAAAGRAGLQRRLRRVRWWRWILRRRRGRAVLVEAAAEPAPAPAPA